MSKYWSKREEGCWLQGGRKKTDLFSVQLSSTVQKIYQKKKVKAKNFTEKKNEARDRNRTVCRFTVIQREMRDTPSNKAWKQFNTCREAVGFEDST